MKNKVSFLSIVALALTSSSTVVSAQTPVPALFIAPSASLVVFLAKGCPCNARCMGELNRLARLLGPQTPLVGMVVGGSASEVPAYRAGLGCAFPLRFDPKGTTALRMKAVCGLDLVLLDGAGKPVKLWEGIGQSTVADLGKELVQRFYVKAPPDPSGVSEIVQTGCPLAIVEPQAGAKGKVHATQAEIVRKGRASPVAPVR